MKKVLIFCLSAALLLAGLTACGKPQSQADASTPDPAASSAQADTSTSDPASTSEPPAQTSAAPEPLSDKTPTAPDENQAGQPPEETAPQEPEEEVPLFADCNETVYATGAVNIRSSWSAESDKLGSLSAGQSVTRTGTAIAGTEAEGWSRVSLSDGTTAYISETYLSTTKPAAQNTGTTAAQPSGGTQGTATTQPSGGGSKGDFVPGPGMKDPAQDTTDWSEYVSSEGQQSTGEERVESWSHVG